VVLRHALLQTKIKQKEFQYKKKGENEENDAREKRVSLKNS
jgi:hypothetical protein